MGQVGESGWLLYTPHQDYHWQPDVGGTICHDMKLPPKDTVMINLLFVCLFVCFCKYQPLIPIINFIHNSKQQQENAKSNQTKHP